MRMQHICMFSSVVGSILLESSLSSCFPSASVVCVSSPSFHVRLPFECSAAVCPYGRALEMRGGFLVLIGANSSGHLPGLSLLACVRLWSGLTDHSVEGHSSTCPPGQTPGWNKNIQLQPPPPPPPHIRPSDFSENIMHWSNVCLRCRGARVLAVG